ncbi:MAG: UDP-3-O-acyl-N-acetylglucosamine deacetylase [Pseudomonadota bacterium]
MQATLARAAKFEGVGVHSGAPATATVRPAPIGSGVTFVRVDVSDRDNRIPASFDQVVDTRLCTVIGNDDQVTVSTIEHLMAALAGLGVTNALIEIDGPETPIMDGSSEPFVRGLMAAGLKAQRVSQRSIRILKRVEVRDQGRVAALAPNNRFEMRFEIDFEEAAIGRQQRGMTLVNGAFVEHLSRARTFGRLADVERLRAAGLARGGSLDNAIVVDGGRVLNEGGLRYEDEFVRHKMLDAIGDLALAGAPIIGLYEGVCAGHEMTNRLLHALFADDQAWCWEFDAVHAGAAPRSLGVDAPVAAAGQAAA